MKRGPKPGSGKKWRTSFTVDIELKPILMAMENTSEFVNTATWREVKRQKLSPKSPSGATLGKDAS